jgi:hypothetical protein
MDFLVTTQKLPASCKDSAHSSILSEGYLIISNKTHTCLVNFIVYIF